MMTAHRERDREWSQTEIGKLFYGCDVIINGRQKEKAQ